MASSLFSSPSARRGTPARGRALYEKLAEPEKKFAWIVLLACLALLGCSSGELPPYLGNTPSPNNNYVSGPCQDGAVHQCSATLDQANGVLSCWKGTQECVEGQWGPCLGELSTQADPRHPSQQSFFRHLALSTPEPCVGNPCDPYCQMFVEDPPDITPTPGGGGGGTIPDWTSPPGTAPCTHQLCETGTALDATCHPCVASVCAAEPTCCSGSWTSACVDLVYTECGAPPPPTGPTVCDFAVFAEFTFTTNGGSASIAGGPLGAGDTGPNAVRLNNVTVDSVLTPGSVFLDNTSVVGDVRAGGSITKQNTVTIGGVEVSGATMEVPELPTKDITCIAESGSVNINSGTQTFAPGEARRININNNMARAILSGPGNYAHVNFNAAGTLVLAQPGTYTFNRLYFGGSTPRLLVPPTGEVNIDVCTDLHFDNGAQVYTWDSAPGYAATTTRPDPMALVW